MAKEKLTVADVLDLIDPNRSGWKFINLFEYTADEHYSVLGTDSIALDSISDKEVDSIGCDEGRISIYLTDEAVEGYWNNNLKLAKEAAAKRKEPTARDIVDGLF